MGRLTTADANESDPLGVGARDRAVVHLGEEDTQSEREEALWCEVVRLRYRINKLTQDVTLRDELIELLREKTTRPIASVQLAPLKLERNKKVVTTHKCEYPPCELQVVGERRYCGQSHNAKHRWELVRQHKEFNHERVKEGLKE